MIKYTKYLIVVALEKLCSIEHFLFHRDNFLGAFWFEWLNMHHCTFARWSNDLDEHWQTNAWVKFNNDSK